VKRFALTIALALAATAVSQAQVLVNGFGGFGFSWGSYSSGSLTSNAKFAYNLEAGGELSLFFPIEGRTREGDARLHLGLTLGCFYGWDDLSAGTFDEPYFELTMDGMRVTAMATIAWYNEFAVLTLSGGPYWGFFEGGHRSWSDTDWWSEVEVWMPSGTNPGDFGLRFEFAASLGIFSDGEYPKITGISTGFYLEFGLANRVSLPGESTTTSRWGIWFGIPVFI
jgi:hypothetical protein